MGNLFEQETSVVALDVLERADFEFFKSGTPLNADHSFVINGYYGRVYNDASRIPFYHCVPLYNSITNDKKFRFLLVSVGGDTVFVAYKIIQILKTRQIRVFDTPISAMGKAASERAVADALSALPFVRFAFSTNVVSDADLRGTERLLEYDNYYYTRRSFFDGLPTWKLNKYGIRLVENGDFRVTTERIPVRDALKIRADFNRYLSDNGHKIAKNDDSVYNLIMSSGCERIRTLAMYYKGEIVYLRVMMVYEELGVAYALYDMQTRYYDRTDKILDKVLSHNMVEKIKYFTFTSFPHIDVVYILGCRPSEHRLLAHKEMICDGKIEYYIK